jgi:hypothetical protein
MKRDLLIFATAAFLVVSCLAQQSSSSASGQVPGQAAVAAPAVRAPAASTSAPAKATAPDPLLDVPPLPNTKVTLVGGTVTGIDRVKNKLSVEAFGGKKMKFVFDERSHIYRDGVETTQLGIRKGDRVYVDSQLDGSQVFARNIRVENNSGPADASGQVISYDAQRGELVLRDQLSAQPVSFRVTDKTEVRGKTATAASADLVPGALVTLRFAPDSRDRGVAQQIQIDAKPGDTFTFVGQVTYLDVSRGLMAIRNQADGRMYEVRFNPSRENNSLTVGSEVTLTAAFDGTGYTTRSLAVRQAKVQ